MKRTFAGLIYRPLASAVMLMASYAGAADLEALRVYAIQSACFDYVFTSVSTGTDGKPTLAFNHRNGRTFLIHVGDNLGEYRLTAHEPKVRRVFIPTTNSEREEKAGQATLTTPDGRLLVLELGQPLSQPGRMAHLTALTSGEWCLVKEKDELILVEDKALVSTVSENAVTILRGSREQVIPLITGEEKEKLAALWAQRRKEAEEARRLALEKPQEEEDTSPPAYTPPARAVNRRRTVEPRSGARAVFGTEFRYPTEFELIPSVTDASGRVIRPFVIIPRQFQTRTSGISIETY
jgi:hypothetical protein